MAALRLIARLLFQTPLNHPSDKKSLLYPPTTANFLKKWCFKFQKTDPNNKAKALALICCSSSTYLKTYF
jgi:hypothetical protein